MKWVPAKIEWLKREEGGRIFPPSGEEPPIYWAVIRFTTCDIDSDVSWSVNVRKVEQLAGSYEWKALVAFRVPEAPVELLVEGADFELFEGPRRVAKGIVGTSSDERATGEIEGGEIKGDGH